jgi:TPR repeat protein
MYLARQLSRFTQLLFPLSKTIELLIRAALAEVEPLNTNRTLAFKADLMMIPTIDQTIAFNIFSQLAERQTSRGLSGLAHCYEDGIGVHQDNKKAAKYYAEAAALGGNSGLLKYAIYLIKEQYPDYKEVVKYLKPLLFKEIPDVYALFEMSLSNGQSRNFSNNKYLRTASELGSLIGMKTYLKHNATKDMHQAAMYALRVAEVGDNKAYDYINYFSQTHHNTIFPEPYRKYYEYVSHIL